MTNTVMNAREETTVGKRVMNVRELAQQLGISVPTAYEVASRADFPSIRVSERRIIIPVSAFNVWLDKQVADKIGNQI